MTRRVHLAACAAFFVSGAAGLVYQVIWSRLFNEVFGISAYAIAAVLATYLGGLALGSSILARRADGHPRPLRFYGQLELGIAATAYAEMPKTSLNSRDQTTWYTRPAAPDRKNRVYAAMRWRRWINVDLGGRAL